MKHYKFWQAPVFAFFSTQFYRELASSASGVGFVYMLALLSIATLVTPVKVYSQFQVFLLSMGQEFAEQMPYLDIENGKLHINQPCPYYIRNSHAQNIVAFDTTGQYQTPSALDVPCLVTADAVLLKTERGDYQTRFAGIQKFHATPNDLMKVFSLGSYMVPIFIYILYLPYAWLGHIIQALALSLAGLILAKSINVNIKYEGILRIASVALGNVIILDAIMQLFPLDIPGYGKMDLAIPTWFLYKAVIALGFTLFGVGANLSPPEFKSVSDDPQLLS